MTVVAFALGMNNFGAGKVKTADVAKSLRRACRGRSHIVSYGSTGNIAIIEPPSDIDLAVSLRRESGLQWWIGDRGLVEGALTALDDWDLGAAPALRRFTPGLAFALVAPTSGRVAGTSRTHLKEWRDPKVVLAQKIDVIDEVGRLDRQQRRGGWGAVSADVHRQIGGQWTSRSVRTVRGLLIRCVP